MLPQAKNPSGLIRKMEEKRDEQVFKHVCRLCNKRYPSGKSLGGHMRSHAMANATYNKAKSKKALTFRVENGVSSVISGDNNGYGLRENPRKSWRMVDHTITTTFVSSNNQEMSCKICGKCFQSSKALCGHMSCHSDRERNFSRFKDEDEEDEESWASDEEDEEDVIDSFSAVNECSYNSSGFELEKEEVAMCLMMLSRDSIHTKIGFHFTAESNSDNNSVILEGGSSSTYAAKSSKNDANGSVKKINLVVPTSKKEVDCDEMDNSDSGYFENGSKELESDDSVDGYAGNYGMKRSRVEYGPEFSNKVMKKVKIDDDDSPRKKYKCSVCRKSFKTHQALGGHIITHKRETKNAYYNGENENADKKKAKMGSKKTKGHCCPFCPKVFKSGQALGGHKRSHTHGGSTQDKANLIKSVEENPPENNRGFIDLNLPATGEEDGNWQW